MNLKTIHLQLVTMNHSENKYLKFTSINVIKAAVNHCPSEENKRELNNCIKKIESLDEKDISLVIQQVSKAESIIESLL